MSELLTMALQMGGCIVVAVPVCAGFVWIIFTAADWLEGRH